MFSNGGPGSGANVLCCGGMLCELRHLLPPANAKAVVFSSNAGFLHAIPFFFLMLPDWLARWLAGWLACWLISLTLLVMVLGAGKMRSS